MRIVLVLLTLVAPLALAQSNGRHGRGAGSDPDAGALPGDDALTCEQLFAEMNTLMAGSGMQNMLAQQQALAAASASQVAKHPEYLPKGQAAETLNNLNKLNSAQADPNAAQSTAPPTADAGAAQAGDSHAQEPADDLAPPRRPGVGKILGQGLLSTFGGGRAAAAAQQRQLEKMAEEGRAAQAAQQPALDAAQAQTAAQSGQIMRGQHLAKLAEAKGCAQQAPTPQGSR